MRFLGYFLVSLTFVFMGCTQSSSDSQNAVSPFDLTQSLSVKYAYLALDNEARMLFTNGENDKVQSYLKGSPHYSDVQNILTPLFDVVNVRSTISLDSNHDIQWIDNGVGKASQVMLIDKTQPANNKQLFTNFQFGIGIADEIFALTLSPDGHYLVVTTAQYGSIDQMTSVVVDVTTQTAVATLNMREPTVAWASPTALIYSRLNNLGNDNLVSLDLTTMNETVQSSMGISGASKTSALLETYVANKLQYVLLNSLNGTQSTIAVPNTKSVTWVGSDNSSAFVLYRNATDDIAQVLQFPLTSGNPGLPNAGTPIATESNLYVEKGWVDTDAIFLQLRSGADRWLRTYSHGQKISEVKIPDCCSIGKVSWSVADAKARVAMTSSVLQNKDFILDMTTGTWDQDPNQIMLTLDGVNYTTELVTTTSQDGTEIPMRLTHRSDASPDGSHIVLLQFYGGFGLAGYLDPRFDIPTREFLRRNGIYATPALRGGNEFGARWHQAAMLANKIKTFEDLDAAARFLVANHWTIPSQIALRGSSNGGLTASATALLFPNDVGLSIPIAGVHDLLGKDRLDATDDGWSSEYGSVAQGKDYLTKTSPVENVGRVGNVKFMIIDGASDTRVNPVNSVKLAKGLEDLGKHSDNIHFLSVVGGGHFVESFAYQNALGLAAEVAIWTAIFDLSNDHLQP